MRGRASPVEVLDASGGPSLLAGCAATALAMMDRARGAAACRTAYDLLLRSRTNGGCWWTLAMCAALDGRAADATG